MSTTVEQPPPRRAAGGLGGRWKVIVRNDNHNTVRPCRADARSRDPGRSRSSGGYAFAQRSPTSGGLAIVWSGHLRGAEHFWEMLRAAGLTMAPLEQA